jgi:branched-chain amino acid transport system permease protein
MTMFDGIDKSKLLFVALCFAALALYPLVGGKYGIDLVTKIMILAIFALSLELLVGGTGLVCFGHAAFFGIGAYVAVKLSPESEAASLFWLLPASVLAAALYALAVGALSLRTKGVYFIMVTLAFAQMAYYVVHDTPLGGGTDGIYLNVKPSVFGPIDLDKPLVFYAFTLAWLVGVFAFLAVLLRSRFGRALAGIRVNEQRMRATGFSTYPYKLAAFTVSGGIAGLAGFLFAVKDGFVNPERGADHDHPRRHRPPARCADRRLRVHAAAGVLQERSNLRRVRQALAPGAGPDDHRQRCAAAQGPRRSSGGVEGALVGQRHAARGRGCGRWLTCSCAAPASRAAGAGSWPSTRCRSTSSAARCTR